jgi:purine catabolism regulator
MAAIRAGPAIDTVGPMTLLRPIDQSRALERRIPMRQLLDIPGLRGAQLVAGGSGDDRLVTGVNVMQVPTDRFARRGVLLLAAGSVLAGSEDAAGLLAGLVRRRAAGLAVRAHGLRELLPPAALAVADQHRFPLIELPERAHLNDLMTELLETIVTDQYRALRADADVRDHLTAFVLSGGGLEALPDAIAETVAGDVVAFDAEGRRLAASEGADVEAAARVAQAWVRDPSPEPQEVPGEGWIVWPLLAGSERLGALVARPAHDDHGVVPAALQHGAANASLQILQEREAAEAVARLRDGFFRDLLRGSLEVAAAERRAAAIGWQPGGYRILMTGAGVVSAARLSELAGGGLAVHQDDASLAVLPHPGADLDALEHALEDVHLGVSLPHTGLDELPVALAEAREALRAARRFDRRVRLRRFEDLGLLQMLSHMPTEELARYHRDVLRPLDTQPDDARATLLATLELLLETGLNVAETARRGGWHYNTVRYRVTRLSELLGPFMTDGTSLESLALALLVRAELHTTDGGGIDG